MKTSHKIGLGVIILLAVLAVAYNHFNQSVSLGAALDCATNTTCLTSLKLTGNPDGTAFAVTGSETHSGAVTNSGAQTFSSTVTVGSGNTAFAGIVGGTCNLTGMDASQGASTTKAYSCTGITGLTSSFKVIAQLATSTPFTSDAVWQVVGSKASTTAGAVDVVIWHGGAAAVPSVAGVGSSTVIFGFN